VVRDLWTAKRRQQAHQKRHHDTRSCAPRTAVIHKWLVRRIRAVVRVIVEAMAGRFRLYDGRTTRLLGAYRTRASAWAAADEHLLTRLAASGDWVVGEYLVVSRCVAASLDVEAQITHLGPADDLEGCRRWLGTLPGRA